MNTSRSTLILNKLVALFGKQETYLSIHSPLLDDKAKEYIGECIDSTWVSSSGRYVNKFERSLEDFTGIKHAIAVVNGTAALHICLRLADVKPGNEVLVPSLTFVASANAIAYCGGIPHFIDNSEKTLGIDVDKLAIYLQEISIVTKTGCINKFTGAKIKAIVVVHTFGHPVDLDPLLELTKKFKLELVEDSAQSLGSLYKGVHTGNFGKISALSFNGNKIITCGGGGAIMTNDDDIAKRAKHITTTAKLSHDWMYYHDMLGFNYRMPNINAALGLSQLEKLDVILMKKRKLAKLYIKTFSDITGISIFKENSFSKSNYWLNALILDNTHALERDEILEITNKNYFQTRPVWHLLHKLPHFRTSPKMNLDVAENLEKRIINLPSSPELVSDD